MFQPNKYISVAAATLAAGFSGAVIASAADSSSTATATATTAAATTPYGGHGGRGGGNGETALTGDVKTKVEAAALAKVPGTVVRSETDNGGVYEAHVKKTDGTIVEVKVDKDFTVTAVNAAPAGGRGGFGGGHGGPGGRGFGGNLTAVAKALDVTEAKLQSAVQAARPDQTDADKSPSETKAQEALDAARKAGEAEHTARETALYAAVAKTLGKSADAVQKAFEANRPTKPTR